MSCSEDDDDPNEMITGSNKNYSINYDNSDSSATSRGYKTTTFKHLGELVKITINNQSSSSKDGVIGFIWDLKQSKSVDGAAVTDSGYQNFFAVGIRNNKETPEYYISKFFNVTDLQADNFGAWDSSTNKAVTVSSHADGIAKTTPAELVVSNFKSLTSSVLSNGTLTVYVDIYPVYSGSKYGVDIANHSSDADGSYVVDFYNADPTDSSANATKLDSVVIGTDSTGYTAKPDQYTLGVYANVYGYKTLNGAWYLAKDYADAEVVEE